MNIDSSTNSNMKYAPEIGCNTGTSDRYMARNPGTSDLFVLIFSFLDDRLLFLRGHYRVVTE